MAQPFAGGMDLRDFLESVSGDDRVHSVRIAVAWAKRSGFRRVKAALELLRKRAHAMEIIIGIDEGGATVQGLEMALDLFTDAFVFHDRSGRTFHSKIYLAWSDEFAHLLVGSHNFTAGGVYFNYEAGIECVLHLDNEYDRGLFQDVVSYLDALRQDSDACIPLDQSALAILCSDPRYRIGDEDQQRKATSGKDAPENLDTDIDIDGVVEPEPKGTSASLFGISNVPKRSAPSLVPGQRRPTPTVFPSGGPSTSPVVRRWYKRMSYSDAQQAKTANSNITGNLKLSKAGHAIDQKSFFLSDFFANANWVTEPQIRGQMEVARIEFDVYVDNLSLGRHSLKVDHAEFRIAGQNNVPTWLHWDGAVKDELHRNSHVGDFVVIERLQDGTFRLSITAVEPSVKFGGAST